MVEFKLDKENGERRRLIDWGKQIGASKRRAFQGGRLVGIAEASNRKKERLWSHVRFTGFGGEAVMLHDHVQGVALMESS